MKTLALYSVVAAFWLGLAIALWFGLLPKPGGGRFQSNLLAGLALLMVLWNLVRIRLLTMRRREKAAERRPPGPRDASAP
jgi:Zn-dependent protease with chaperone function